METDESMWIDRLPRGLRELTYLTCIILMLPVTLLVAILKAMADAEDLTEVRKREAKQARERNVHRLMKERCR